jgi:hypothetical protein
MHNNVWSQFLQKWKLRLWHKPHSHCKWVISIWTLFFLAPKPRCISKLVHKNMQCNKIIQVPHKILQWQRTHFLLSYIGVFTLWEWGFHSAELRIMLTQYLVWSLSSINYFPLWILISQAMGWRSAMWGLCSELLRLPFVEWCARYYSHCLFKSLLSSSLLYMG